MTRGTLQAVLRAAARPRRSALYRPGSNARALEKARTLPCDVLILDLEDAVAPEKKELARTQIVEALKDKEAFGRREVVVRVNGLDTPWGIDDLRALAHPINPAPDAILLPKVESIDPVAEAYNQMAIPTGGGHGSGRGGLVPIWCMVETPLGVLRAPSLAEDARVGCLVAGTSDLSTDLRCDGEWNSRAALAHSLSHTVLAARAFGKAVLDGVHLQFKDLDRLEHSCIQGRNLGFDGKTLIHPTNIETANKVFSPSDEEVARAREVIEAFEEASRAGSALAVLNGKLIEALHVREAERLLELCKAIS
jgi:citrate lyase subunit beta/citryl-CoA lyase